LGGLDGSSLGNAFTAKAKLKDIKIMGNITYRKRHLSSKNIKKNYNPEPQKIC